MSPAPTTDATLRSLGVLARGGMGQVELAIRRQGAFARVYAVKRLHVLHRHDPNFRAMFMEEARLAGMLRHANVVSVLDTGEDSRGPFLVMDFIDSITTSQLIAWASREGELLPVQVAARIVRQAAMGITAAHELHDSDGRRLDLVHRDISPQNILLGFDGTVRVTDFGIAKALGHHNQSTTGLLKGKSGYMAPEQLRLERASQASDLFALGVVLFELLASRRLYKGRDALEVAHRVLTEPIPDIFAIREDVHPAICELLFEMLAKSRELRPTSARDVVERLGWAVDELSAEEGAVRLDSFLEKNFRAEKDKAEQLRRAAQAKNVTTIPGLLPFDGEIAAPPPVTSKPQAKWAAAALGVAVAMGVAFGLWSDEEADVAEIAPSAESPVPQAPPTQLAGPSEPADESATPVTVLPSAASAPAPAGSPPPAAPAPTAAPERPARMRARPRRRPRTMAAAPRMVSSRAVEEY